MYRTAIGIVLGAAEGKEVSDTILAFKAWFGHREISS